MLLLDYNISSSALRPLQSGISQDRVKRTGRDVLAVNRQDDAPIRLRVPEYRVAAGLPHKHEAVLFEDAA